MLPRINPGRALLTLGCALLMATATSADVSNIVFSVEASNQAGTGVYEVTADQLTYNPQTDTWFWVQLTPVPIMDGNVQIATLNNANIALRTDPQIGLGFAVQAGSTDTDVTVSSALLTFPTIPAAVAEGQASAGFTVTDLDGDGASLVGLGAPGTGAYRADYNGLVPNGTMFASLVGQVSAGPNASGSGSQTEPAAGFASIPVDVSSMSTQAAFTLSANDLGSGTNQFVIVPEPAGVLLLAVASLILRRR